MKKQWLVLLIGILFTFALAGCGGDEAKEESKTTDNISSVEKKEEKKEPLDLVGEWKQVDGNSEESYQRATIQEGTMEIYWVNEAEESEALYWAGTYVAPEKDVDTYTWDSVNDKEKTDSALLASGDDQKTFTYEDGKLSYSVSAMGMTQTVYLEKVK